ncbi:MAG: hypothetical protein LBD07_01850 [Spirochaetaceae bacterium]|nr:hypothetical protein [Spirochaetaceae bacterium]
MNNHQEFACADGTAAPKRAVRGRAAAFALLGAAAVWMAAACTIAGESEGDAPKPARKPTPGVVLSAFSVSAGGDNLISPRFASNIMDYTAAVPGYDYTGGADFVISAAAAAGFSVVMTDWDGGPEGGADLGDEDPSSVEITGGVPCAPIPAVLGEKILKKVTVSNADGTKKSVYTITLWNKTMAQGGEITFDGATHDEIHTFEYKPAADTGGQTAYTFTVNEDCGGDGELLIVAGGGAGGDINNETGNWAAGGGAGGVIYYGRPPVDSPANFTRAGESFTFLPEIAYAVKAGKGGVNTTAGWSGGAGVNSEFGPAGETLTAYGGGGGGGNLGSGVHTGGEGGSGGGSWIVAAAGPAKNVTPRQGNPSGAAGSAKATGGGGAGASSPAAAAIGDGMAGNGGAGVTLGISGAPKGYGGGGATGAGGGNSSYNVPSKHGTASHGGGATKYDGAAGTGGGGAGATGTSDNGHAGGSGVVIVRLPFSL